MSDRKAAERAAFERVFNPHSHVLVNELGLRDAASLDAAERLFTDTRIEEGMPNTTPMAQLILARIQTLQLAENGRGPDGPRSSWR